MLIKYCIPNSATPDITEIADVTREDGNLLGEVQAFETLADDEQNFLKNYRHLDDTCKKIAKVIIESMIDCLN